MFLLITHSTLMTQNNESRWINLQKQREKCRFVESLVEIQVQSSRISILHSKKSNPSLFVRFHRNLPETVANWRINSEHPHEINKRNTYTRNREPNAFPFLRFSRLSVRRHSNKMHMIIRASECGVDAKHGTSKRINLHRDRGNTERESETKRRAKY